MDKYSSNKLAGNFNVYHLHYLRFAASFEDSVGKISSEVSMLWIQPWIESTFSLCEEELKDPSHVTQKQLNKLCLDFHPKIHLNDLESQE